jgi:two-component system, NarL family, sensor histidine kinase DesK
MGNPSGSNVARPTQSIDYEVVSMAQEPTTAATKASDRGPAGPAGASKTTADASLRNLLPLAWPLFAVMWLVFPVASVVDMLETDLTPVRLLAFLALMVAYVAIYLWLVLRYPFRGGGLSSPERLVHVALLATLAALALCLEIAYGSGIPYQFMFVVIAAAVTLPTLPAALTVVAIMALTSGIYALRSGWDTLSSSWESAVAPFAIVGFSMIIVSRLVLTVRELRAAREEIARLAVAEERLRFARDLHDLLGHSLSSITLKSELAGRLLPAAPDKAAAEVRDIESVARDALREVREAVAGYRQPILDEELASAQQILEAAGIACEVERNVGVLPNDVDAVLAWAVREGTTNVIRHSRATHCQIRVMQEGEEIRAEISDDGVGFSSEGDEIYANGSGLSGLAERVASVAGGGKIETESPPGGGFRLRVSLPLQNGPDPCTEPASGAGVARENERS